MRSLVYASRAVQPFGDDDLLQLLRAAPARNDVHGVTGMLVYAAGSFLQLFEGEDDAVEVIWDRIRMDPRHTGLRVLQDGPARARLFAEWPWGSSTPSSSGLKRR